MSSKATLIWLVLALAMGAAALFLLKGPGKSSADNAVKVGDPVLTFDPAKLHTIRIQHPDGSSETIDRRDSQGWAMVVKVAGRDLPPVDPSDGRAGWPVPDTRIQGLVRHLLDAKARALPAADNAIGAQPTVVVLELQGSQPITLKLADRSLGGLALIEVSQPQPAGASLTRAIIDDQIHAFFRGTAPREWRDRTAISGLSMDCSRITLANDRNDRIALGKVDGLWSLREPFGSPGDPASIQRLLQIVSSVQIVDFLDQGVPGGSTGLEKPAAKLVIETDVRGEANTPAKVNLRELTIGGPADSRGDRVFAALGEKHVVIIDARAIAELKLDPAAYAWRHPTRLNPADIGVIVLEREEPPTPAASSATAAQSGKVLQRSLGRWVQVQPDGKELAMSPGEQKSVDELLAFLCGPTAGTSPADPSKAGVTPTIAGSAPEGYLAGGSIKLLSVGSRPLDSLEISRLNAGKVTIRTAGVYRTYAGEQVHPLIIELATAPVRRDTPDAPMQEPDTNK
jgi:hypothetical protein